MSPTKWVELTAAIGILTKNGDGGRAGAVGCRQPTAAHGNLQRSQGFGSRPHYRKHVIGHEYLMPGVWEFIKWVGGKSQLIDQLDAHLPVNFGNWENVTYIELNF